MVEPSEAGSIAVRWARPILAAAELPPAGSVSRLLLRAASGPIARSQYRELAWLPRYRVSTRLRSSRGAPAPWSVWICGLGGSASGRPIGEAGAGASRPATRQPPEDARLVVAPRCDAAQAVGAARELLHRTGQLLRRPAEVAGALEVEEWRWPAWLEIEARATT